MNFLIKLILSASLIITSHFAIAEELKTGCETAINCTVTQGNTTTTVSTAPTTTGGTTLRRQSSGNTTTTTTTNYGTAGTSGSGAYTQAQNAKNQANTTMIAAFAMAAMLAAMCNPPTNVTPCILAPLAAMAGMMAGQKKAEAQRVMDSIGTSGTTDSATTTDGSVDGGAGERMAQIKADLAKKGISMNADGSTTMPNGSTIAPDLNSQSLKSAGLSDSQISKLNKELDKLKKDLKDKSGTTVIEEVGTASAGGYDGSRTSVGDDDREVRAATAENERTDVGRDPAAWNGFFKQLGDSQIGVAQADIFIMVEKRVETERKTMGH